MNKRCQCFSIARSYERRFPPVGRRKKVGRLVFVSLSVCLCVQAFPGTAPERLVRSGPGWHRWTRRNAGTRMVPVVGRPAARDTWHVPPREGLPKIFEQPYRSHGGHHRSETRRSHAYCTNLKSIGGAVPVGCQLHAPGA